MALAGIKVFIAVIGSVVWWVNPEGRLNGKIEAAKKSGTASLDLSSFDTSSVKDMLMMFDGCKNLQTVYLGDGWTDKWIEYVKDEYPDINFIMK